MATSGLATIARVLEEAGAIGNPTVFRIGARYTGMDQGLRFGEYEIPARASMEEILASIRRIISDGDDSRKSPPPPHLAVVERAPVPIRAAGRDAPSAEEPAPLAAIEGIVAAVEATGGTDGAELAAFLEGLTDFPTLTGPISFSSEFHTVFGREYRVIVVQDGEHSVVDIRQATSPADIG